MSALNIPASGGMFALALAQIEAGQKSLSDEIVAVLSGASEPMTVRDISVRLVNPPDRQTISREIFLMAQAGRIQRIGEIPAPSGMPRKTVATYAIQSTTREH